jgi:hypothetical protein
VQGLGPIFFAFDVEYSLTANKDIGTRIEYEKCEKKKNSSTKVHHFASLPKYHYAKNLEKAAVALTAVLQRRDSNNMIPNALLLLSGCCHEKILLLLPSGRVMVSCCSEFVVSEFAALI